MPRVLECPVCTNVMARRNFGRKSAVIIDICPQHGTWLDGGELSRLIKWVEAGGLNIVDAVRTRKEMPKIRRLERNLEKIRRRDTNRMLGGRL